MPNTDNTTTSPTIILKPYDSRPKVYTVIEGDDMTKQSFKDECDINVLLKRYEETGLISHVRDSAPRYLDATGFDYQEAMYLVAEANSVFENLPSRVRERFDNDPAKLLEFVHDPKNLAESIELGFIDPDKAPQPAAPVEGAKAEPASPGTAA